VGSVLPSTRKKLLKPEEDDEITTLRVA
jgi:hypothetical protein